jgi:hypothetical protein
MFDVVCHAGIISTVVTQGFADKAAQLRKQQVNLL